MKIYESKYKRDDDNNMQKWRLIYMSPAEWIRQAEWIKIANIHFFEHCKKIKCLYL